MNWVKHLNQGDNRKEGRETVQLSHMKNTLTRNNTNSTQDYINQLDVYTTNNKKGSMVLPRTSDSNDSYQRVQTNEHEINSL